MFQIRAKIVYNKRVKEPYHLLAVQGGGIASKAAPGQFLQIKVNKGLEPLLRRPFSIHAIRGTLIEILYEVVGEGSSILSKRKAGEFIDIIGPLGNGFSAAKAPNTGKNKELKPVLVAGGIGVAPLFFLAKKLKQAKPVVLIGARTKSLIICEKEFLESGCDVKTATDDGSFGFKGRVTELLEKTLSSIDYRLLTIYACGPEPMLKEISRIALKHNIPAQISLEAHMACGIGACLGCVVNTKEGFKRVCKEGPVFNCETIVWQKKGAG
jgi:dihydroorotate dehydrogenase electron transfer subunit